MHRDAAALRRRLLQSQLANRQSKISGYSFTEVMFAVVVLGIGFIMIAAMFPVAIQQSRSTAEETTAAGVARGALNYVQTIATNANMPDTDVVPAQAARTAPFIATTPGTPVNTGYWNAVKGNLILATDPRFAFVPLYRREQGSQFAQVILIITQCRARPTYDASDVTPATEANLQPRAVKVTVTNNGGGTGVDWIEITDGAIAGTRLAAAEGAYVVIGIDPGKSPSPAGTFNGRMYRIGAPATDAAGAAVPDTWTLSPGNDFIPAAGVNNLFEDGAGDDWHLGDDADAFIVGREPETVGSFATFRGIAQDVSVYTSFVQVRP